MVAPGSGQRDPFPWHTVGKLVVALVVTGILGAGLLLPYVGGLGLAARHEATKFLDTPCNLQESPPPRTTTLYASDNKTVIANLFVQDREPVQLSAVPKSLQDALVATEDRRFYSHHGVDMRGLIRSAVSTSGGDTQGGSTLTMQYVKQIRYYQAGTDLTKQQNAIAQNLNRKIEDAKCAIYFENTKHESKSQILENYLNIAFFGENAYGIQRAAKTYFGKSVNQLTLPQSALLVGLLRAPSQYDPFRYPEAAKERRNQVLQNLVDVGKLPQAQADQYKKAPLSLYTKTPPIVRQGCANASAGIRNAGFFCDYVVDWLENVEGISPTELTTGGLRIVTTLDAQLQNATQQRLQSTIPATSPMTAVLPIVDPATGNVLAMATSKFYGQKASSKDNTHTVLPIFTGYTGQGASTFKLFPLLTALQTGVPSNWSVYTPPTREQTRNGAQGPAGYRTLNCQTDSTTTNGDALENYSNNETLRSATVKSSNTFFVGMADQLFGCDLKPIVDMAASLGIKSLQEQSGDGNFTIAQSILNYQRAQELVLGDVPTSPLELAGAYAAVANGGRFNAPAPVMSITDQNTRQPMTVKRSPGVQVVSPQVAAQAVQILTGDTTFPGTSASEFQSWYAQHPGHIVAGKTGTSVAVVNNKETQENASLWFVGMTPKYVGVSALINFDAPSSPAAGLPNKTDAGTTAYGAYAAGVWLSALGPSLTDQTWTWPAPSAMAGVPVPPLTGKTVTDAKALLAGVGLKLVQLDAANSLTCASSVTAGSIAFYGPQIATPGSAVTVCLSSGVPQQTYVPPRTTPTRGAGSSGPPITRTTVIIVTPTRTKHR